MDMVVAVLPGDGIGPEVVSEGVRVLEVVAEQFRHSFQIQPRRYWRHRHRQAWDSAS